MVSDRDSQSFEDFYENQLIFRTEDLIFDLLVFLYSLTISQRRVNHTILDKRSRTPLFPPHSKPFFYQET